MKKILLSSIATMLIGFEFQPIGFKSVSMGGAGVADNSNSLVSYYNPALLAKHERKLRLYIGTGIGSREINLANHVDNLANKYKLSETIDTIVEHAPVSGSNDEKTRNNIKASLKELYALSRGNGLELQPNSQLFIQVGSFSLGVNLLTDLRANAIIDRDHLYLIFEDKDKGGYYYYNPDTDVYGATDIETYKKYSLEYALNNKLTYIDVKGIILDEVPISYAFSYSFNNVNYNFGVSLKYMQGITYQNILAIDTDSKEIKDSLDKNSKTTVNFGADIGFLMNIDRFNFGLVAKNLNSPEFKFKDGSKVKLSPMVRSGIYYKISDYWNLAMDIDLTENSTLIRNYSSQYLGAGAEFRLKDFFSLRFGAMRNLVEDDEGIIGTFGIGLGLKWLKVNLSGAISSKTGHLNSEKIPRYTRVNLSISSEWGGK